MELKVWAEKERNMEEEEEEETRILHHLGIARNFLHSVHGMLVFGDRDEEGYHVQSSY